MNNSRICFSEVLFFIFLTLKLCDVISWSWWWVTAPLWIPVVLIFYYLFLIDLSIMLDNFKNKR